LMAFLFIWQFILSGPMEIASGYIGFQQYLSYICPNLTKAQGNMVMIALGLAAIFLLYRRIGSIGKIMISLWIGTLLTTAVVIVFGAANFNAARAFDYDAGSWKFSFGFLMGLGAAARVGIYDFLGYYDVCYIGEEVREPAKVIPRSILISLFAVALIYIGINLSIVGTISWREFVPANDNPKANFIVSIFMERVAGSKVAVFFTVLVLWTAFASVFALLLGYSRIPYAAARDGYFFKVFGMLHPTKNFPHVSVLVVGGISILCSFFSLGVVIDALITSRIVIQFIGQIFAVRAIRRNRPELPLPFRMWLYPLPGIIALAGWSFLFITSGTKLVLLSCEMLALGGVVFLAWSWHGRKWPFAPSAAR
jgi:amino acid transporter